MNATKRYLIYLLLFVVLFIRLDTRIQFNSNKFVFDTEIIIQSLMHHFKIEEIPIQARYFDEASNIKLLPSIVYGLEIVWALIKYILHTKNIYKFKQFE